MFNDAWMADQGFVERPHQGDLRDLIVRRHDEGAAITVAPDDTLNFAYSRMKLYDVSQLPVLVDDNVVGIIDESDLLMATFTDSTRFAEPVSLAMSARVETVPVAAPLDSLLRVFDRGHVVVVVDGMHFLVNHLRRKVD
jgi:cystathionine beta-synthase